MNAKHLQTLSQSPSCEALDVKFASDLVESSFFCDIAQADLEDLRLLKEDLKDDFKFLQPKAESTETKASATVQRKARVPRNTSRTAVEDRKPRMERLSENELRAKFVQHIVLSTIFPDR